MLLVALTSREGLSAESFAASERVVFYQYKLPLDPSVASWRLETDRGRERPTMALHLRGRNASGKLRGDFSIARGVVETAEALERPRETPSSIDLAYDVLRDREIGEKSRVTVALRGSKQEKMVKDVAGSAAVNLVLAIFPWLESSATASPWSAKVGVGLARIRQLIAQGTASSGDREVSTTLQTVGAQWSQQWLTVDYRFAFTGVDRAGDARDEPSTLQTLLASFQPDPRFTLRAGVARGQVGPRDPASRFASLGFDWQFHPSVTLSGGCDADVGSGPEKATKRGCGISGALAKTLELLGPLRWPIDLYAVPSFGTTRARSHSTDLASNDWSIDAGFSLRF